MVNVVNNLVARGVVVQSEGQWELQGRGEEVASGVPESLQQLIAQQVERLRPEIQRMLEVASVAGAEFSAAAVAAGMETEIDVIEEQCEALVRREHFLRASGTAEWPDGTVAARYGFLHAVYQDVLYHRLTARRRQRVHQQIGEREEQGYGEQAREIAAELAVHFEQGRDYRRAVQYLRHAGENAVWRSAPQEAINLFTKGLELLKTLPDTLERTQQEILLEIALGGPLQATRGFAAPEAERVYTRVRELCQQAEETPQIVPALSGLTGYYLLRAELQTARELGEQLLTLTQRTQKPARLALAHYMLGTTFFWLGELALTRSHLEQEIALYDRQQYRPPYLQEPMVCLSYMARVLWFLGLSRSSPPEESRGTYSGPGAFSPFQSGLCVRSCCRVGSSSPPRRASSPRGGRGSHHALNRARICTHSGGGNLAARLGTGRARAKRRGARTNRQGLAAWQATGAELSRPYVLALLAEAYGKVGQAEEGLTLLAEALDLVQKTGERVWEAELYRLKGELLLAQEGSRLQAGGFREKAEEAEECFLKAIDIAQKQQAKSLELRATMSLARLWQQQGKKEEARQMLAEIYNWFTEGFDTKDLQEAKTLLEELQ